jgi:hypothetical protein
VLPDSVACSKINKIYVQAVEEIDTLVILPVRAILDDNLRSDAIVPLILPEESELVHLIPFTPRMVEMVGWNQELYNEIRDTFPEAQICLRMQYAPGEEILKYAESGIRVFHLVANYHGRGREDKFVYDLIREAHQTLVDTRQRDEFTLLGSGGIIAAEHVTKAIIAGLDAVFLDTPLLVALQGKLGHGKNELLNRHHGSCKLPLSQMTPDWAVQRLKNLTGAWRDQMLEMMGAMGLREVRRLRGEMGRAMFQKALERETFENIEGYSK